MKKIKIMFKKFRKIINKIEEYFEKIDKILAILEDKNQVK